MRRVPRLSGAAAAGGLLVAVLVVAAVLLDRGKTDANPVEVIFGDSNGLPEEIIEGGQYIAAFQIEWTGPVTMRDGEVSVFASRRGDTTEDAPEENWPLVCESDFDDVQFRQRVSCPFEAPGPGEFALLLEVRDSADSVIGQGLYTHLVIDPTATTSP
jgi:hypothetical protein